MFAPGQIRLIFLHYHQKGYKLPEKFFQNTNWRDQLDQMRVEQTQKIILSSYMKSIERLVLAEAKITQAIIKFESNDIELLENCPGIGQLTSRVIAGAVAEIRMVLLQCAHTVARMKIYEALPLKQFFKRTKKRRVKKIAVIALARKLLTIAQGILKSKTAYDPALLNGSVA